MSQYPSVAEMDFDDGAIRPIVRNAPAFIRPLSPRDPSAGVRPSRERRVAARRAPHEATAERLRDLALAALEKLHRGVLLLSGDGFVQFANRAARTMLNRKHGLALARGRVLLADPLAASTVNAFFQSGHRCLVLHIKGPDYRHGGYRILISALDEELPPNGYCMFVYEPFAGHRALPVKLLTDLYGLTAGEARLVNALFTGRSLNQAAAALQVTKNTAKSALKRIFVKCEVASQAELLQLLSLGPRTL